MLLVLVLVSAPEAMLQLVNCLSYLAFLVLLILLIGGYSNHASTHDLEEDHHLY